MNREALRQHMLVRALWRDDAALQDDVRGLARAPAARGVAAYRGNAGALAERALGSAYPTIAAMVGAESFARLARHFWHVHPPARGDIAEWGHELPAFIAASAQLADEPVLPDSARLDWAVHLAARAANTHDEHDTARPVLDALANTDPQHLRARLAPGAAVIDSAWPIAAVWQAHHGTASFDDARAAFAAQRGEHAFVWRDAAHRVHVEPLDAADAVFTAALAANRTLAGALDAASDGFAFDRWLARAIGARWLIGFSTDTYTRASSTEPS